MFLLVSSFSTKFAKDHKYIFVIFSKFLNEKTLAGISFLGKGMLVSTLRKMIILHEKSPAVSNKNQSIKSSH